MPRTSQAMNIWMRQEEKAGPPPGSYGVGWGAGPNYSDAFRFRRSPAPAELVENFKGVCFSCVNLNMNGVARTPLRLYATTGRGQPRPKCMTKSVSRLAKARLKSYAYASKAMANADEVEEVTEHPLLDTVMKVNEDLDFIQLLSFTVMCLDITGNAYWWPSFGGQYGIPDEIWALPSHLVFPQFSAGQMVPDTYQFGGVLYPKDSLVRFRRLSAKNPYGQGYSPLQAAIEYARLESTWVSSQDDMLSNGPRPSVIVSHRDPKGAFGAAERQRLDHDLNTKTRGGRSGAAIIVDGAAAVTPVSWTPTDVGGMQIGSYDLERIANSFDVPVSMLKTEDVNRANADAGLEQHARNAIEPRCKLIASTLTRWTQSLDKTKARGWDRLFWAFDPAVKEDAQAEADLHTKYIAMGLPLNVALTEAGYEKVEGGDVSFVASNLQTLENAVKPPEPPPMPGQQPGGEEEEPDPLAEDEDEAESKALMDLCGKVLADIDAELKAAKKPKGKPKKKPAKKPGGGRGAGTHAGCGTGAGGFKPGNTCATGGRGGAAEKVDASPKARRAAEDETERVVAQSVGGKRLDGYEPYDVIAPKSGKTGGNHVVEVKSMHYGSANRISVHAGALADKVKHIESNPKDTFHTIVIDRRKTSEGGAHSDKYSGHEVYYKRASGPYSLSTMYKCKDLAHAKRLMEMVPSKLPAKARGEFPSGEALESLKAKAKADREYNNQRSRERKERLGRAAYGKPPKPSEG